MKHSNVILKPIGMPTSWCGIQTIGETAKALLAPLQRDRQRGRERFMGHQRPRMTYSPRWLWCALTRWVEHHSKLCRGKHPYEAARCAPVPESRPPGRSLQQREMVAFGEMVSTRWSGIQWQLNLPSSVLLMTILWLSSRFHLIDGSGLPFALQRRVTLSPSRTMTSLEVSASSMFGGTVREKERRGRKRGMKGVGYYYSCRLNINSKQVAAAAELDLNAKTFAFWQRLERHESGISSREGTAKGIHPIKKSFIIWYGVRSLKKYSHHHQFGYQVKVGPS